MDSRRVKTGTTSTSKETEEVRLGKTAALCFVIMFARFTASREWGGRLRDRK